MISFNELSQDFKDPLELKTLGVFTRMEIQNHFEGKRFIFSIPENIIDNKDKKCYQAGFLNEMQSIFNPTMLKKDIFKFVTKELLIFVDERQYQNMIKEYALKKYSVFIKK